MSTDAPIQPLRKKRSIMWWLGAFFLLLALIFVYELFGPNPPVVVSHKTTYITEPLSPNGLPDYKKYLRELYRNGVTPENNAAVLLWQALWPNELDSENSALVAKELGLAQIPSKDKTLCGVYDKRNLARITSWLQEQPVKNARSPMNDKAGDGEDLAEQVAEFASSQPWTGEQIPPLAQWVRENQEPLDLIVAASRRSRYYSPTLSLLNNDSEMLITISSPGAESAKEVARSLPARAMWHLGEGRPMNAWRDLFAIHRICHLMADADALYDQLVSFGMSFIACDATVTLLDHAHLTVEQASQVQQDLASLPDFAIAARAFDRSERFSAIDTYIHLAAEGGFIPSVHVNDEETDLGLRALNYVSVDWNVVLSDTNQWYDRFAEAAHLADQAQRSAAFSQIGSDVERRATSLQSPWIKIASAINRQQRSKILSSVMLAKFLPGLHSILIMQDRVNTELQLTRTAAALAVYRVTHGTYPAKLDDLVPSVVDKMPVDLYSGQAFMYKRTNDGYLLYSVGENGQDDGGSSQIFETLEGRRVSDLDDISAENLRAKIANDADDWSIRLPRPAAAPPWPNPLNAQR